VGVEVGRAPLAGLAEGVWSSLDEIGAQWQLDREFTPAVSPGAANQRYAGWQRAVERSRAWAPSDDGARVDR